MKRLLIGLLLAASLWGWGNGYTYRRTITIDHSKCGTADSSNFPMLFSGTYSYLAHTDHGGKVTNSNGYDIIFTSDAAGSTQLKHEIESYDHETGAVNFWVKIPTLDADADTVIYLFYGNSSISTSQEDIHNTWSSDYYVVFHMRDGGSTSTVGDSTSHDYHGTKRGAGQPAETTGKIGKAQQFVSNAYSTNNDYFAFTEADLTTLTVSFWLNIANGNYQTIVNRAAWTTTDMINTNPSPCSIGYKWTYDTKVEMSDNVWNYVTITRDGANTNIILNGTSHTYSNENSTSHHYMGQIGLQIALTGFGYRAPNGKVDEVRISNVAKSVSFTTADYNSQSSPSTFYTLGDEDTGVGGRRKSVIILSWDKRNVVGEFGFQCVGCKAARRNW